MRIALLADIHSNLPALEAVLRDVEAVGVYQIWVAGDLVGYNPWPNQVLAILRERKVRAIRGNHDRAALSGDTSWFNELAAAAVRWTRIVLTPASVGYLTSLEDRVRVALPDGTVAMYHGSPRNDDEYVMPWAADEALVKVAAAPFVILGHTHVPMAFSTRYGILVNPGSVGQPRDRDPRAAWALLETATGGVEQRRVPYDIGKVIAEIHKAGLPPELGERLTWGV
ncbi:MAG TPA: metallophosphoesterase family protein [Thermoplasmata archaeon]|nr:metallophosphoesterase family protein [Thermoplasmata archaeon]